MSLNAFQAQKDPPTDTIDSPMESVRLNRLGEGESVAPAMSAPPPGAVLELQTQPPSHSAPPPLPPPAEDFIEAPVHAPIPIMNADESMDSLMATMDELIGEYDRQQGIPPTWTPVSIQMFPNGQVSTDEQIQNGETNNR